MSHFPSGLIKSMLMVQKKQAILSISENPDDQATAAAMQLAIIRAVDAIDNWDIVAMIQTYHNVNHYLKDDFEKLGL